MPRTRANPGVFGQDLVSIGWKALGLVGSGAVADKFIWPMVKNVAPGQGAVSQLMHGITTFGTAIALGAGVGAMGQRAIGRDITEGGAILGVGEAIGSVVPGFTVSGTFPTALPAISPAALKAANGTAMLNAPTNAPAISAPVNGRVYSGI